MRTRKYFCPQCQNPIEDYYIPAEIVLTDTAEQPVCRCTHCDAYIDDQVQAMLSQIMEEEALQEWIWNERLRIVRSINVFDELIEYWKILPASLRRQNSIW